jgi:acyl-CoA hydrolase
MKTPIYFSKSTDACDFIFKSVGTEVRLAAPLGLGKPNVLLNHLFDRVSADASLKLRIYTALSLALPSAKEELAKLFLEPFATRHLGKNYPQLKYSQAAITDTLPANIAVHEFYVQAGSALRSNHLQRNYQSVNYTHAAENVFRADVNVIVQMIAKRGEGAQARYSLSCNPDMTLDVVDIYKENNKPLCLVGVVHPDLPFLGGEAEVPADFFSAIVDGPESAHELFALPRTPISKEDHLIGLYASQLVRDGGTLQIGIGSLSDAIVSSLRLRQQENSRYLAICEQFRSVKDAQQNVFETGLYGLTEMLTDGFMHLRQCGILKRHVVDEITGTKTYVHGSFYLGSKAFYQWLRTLPEAEAQGLRMTRVSKVNDLYDPQETLLRRQRIHPRFFNTTMQVSLLGEAMSETLTNGHVVSGVGGQYNFVAMSSELKDSRSILMLRSYRLDVYGKRTSNILWKPCHVTIPRHLRDMVITEYGVADLKGKSDEECVKALLAITDSEFQDELMNTAKKQNKLAKDYQLPEELKNNTPQSVAEKMRTENCKLAFQRFPFGSDFTPEEERLTLALEKLQADKKETTLKILQKYMASTTKPQAYRAELERMQLYRPNNWKSRFYQKLLLAYLE